MFNLLPGQGLGFTGSKEIAFGLAPVIAYTPVIPPPAYVSGGGGGGGFAAILPDSYTIYDNAYSVEDDDNEVVEILTIISQVIE